jgi:hypothetical protein
LLIFHTARTYLIDGDWFNHLLKVAVLTHSEIVHLQNLDLSICG